MVPRWFKAPPLSPRNCCIQIFGEFRSMRSNSIKPGGTHIWKRWEDKKQPSPKTGSGPFFGGGFISGASALAYFIVTGLMNLMWILLYMYICYVYVYNTYVYILRYIICSVYTFMYSCTYLYISFYIYMYLYVHTEKFQGYTVHPNPLVKHRFKRRGRNPYFQTNPNHVVAHNHLHHIKWTYTCVSSYPHYTPLVPPPCWFGLMCFFSEMK